MYMYTELEMMLHGCFPDDLMQQLCLRIPLQFHNIEYDCRFSRLPIIMAASSILIHCDVCKLAY